MNKLARLLLWAGLVVAPATTGLALINPKFTPVDIVEQSGQILQLEAGPVDAAGGVPVRVVKSLKGEAPAGVLTLDLTKTLEPQADALREAVGRERKQLGLLFIEKPEKEAGAEAAGAPPAPKAAGLLSVRGLWFRLAGAPNGRWLLDARDDQMQSCWAGGTDMLLRAVDYIRAEPHATVPATAGVGWASTKKVAAVEGKVRGMTMVDLGRREPRVLHALGEGGDHLFQWDAAKETLADVTAKRKLAATSRAAAWADFNADGRLDLASWDGRSLRLHLQKEDGAFEAKETGIELKECLGLAAIDVGVKGRMGILASTPALPMLLTPDADGALKPAPLLAAGQAGFPGADLGAARACLVADLDGDGLCDILQPFAGGALFYKGTKPGVFAPPQVLKDVRTGPGAAGAFLGDYDADGLLDVFVGAEEGCHLWQNLGGGKFEEALSYAGEAAYISKPRAIGGATGDVNSDGRQDILILYDDRPPQVFFNRGFRAFGHAHELDVEEQNLLPEAGQGQQAGLLADLDGDGNQDMALALANGEIWIFLREATEPRAACVRAILPVGGPWGGPATVAGTSGRQALGAWNVVAGTAEAFFARRTPGPIQIRWQFAGAKPQEKTISAAEGTALFQIGRE